MIQYILFGASWGSGGHRQLGYGDASSRGSSADQMGDYLPEVELPTGFVAERMITTLYTTFVLSSAGEIVCFGRNIAGLCGLGHANTWNEGTGDSLQPIDLGTDFVPAQLGGGGYTACAISAVGEVKWCVFSF